MGAGSVTNSSDGAPSWKLASPHDRQTQGIVVSGFGDLPSAQALFLMCDWPDEPAAAGPARKGAWLQALTMVAPITDSDGSYVFCDMEVTAHLLVGTSIGERKSPRAPSLTLEEGGMYMVNLRVSR